MLAQRFIHNLIADISKAPSKFAEIRTLPTSHVQGSIVLFTGFFSAIGQGTRIKASITA